MARPMKQGLDYFPLDVDIFNDAKIEELNFKYSYLGEIVYLRLLTMIYRNGYFLEVAVPMAAKQLIRAMGPQLLGLEKEIEEIILYLGDLDLLDRDLLFKGVLTSRNIQRQFILSTKRRKRINIKKHWLISKDELEELNFYVSDKYIHGEDNNLVNDSNNIVNVNNNEVNACSNGDTVNKKYTKESKVKKSNDKKIKDKGTFQVPIANFLTNNLIKNKYIEEDPFEIMRFNGLFNETVKDYGFDDVLSVTDYLIKYSKREGVIIENKFSFFKESLYKNLEMLIKRGEYKNGTIEEFFKRKLL